MKYALFVLIALSVISCQQTKTNTNTLFAYNQLKGEWHKEKDNNGLAVSRLVFGADSTASFFSLGGSVSTFKYQLKGNWLLLIAINGNTSYKDSITTLNDSMLVFNDLLESKGKAVYRKTIAVEGKWVSTDANAAYKILDFDHNGQLSITVSADTVYQLKYGYKGKALQLANEKDRQKYEDKVLVHNDSVLVLSSLYHIKHKLNFRRMDDQVEEKDNHHGHLH